jgi:CDP-paratose 2-epimerase
MNVVLATGSAGLIGSESVEFFSKKYDLVIGIDNNTREKLFGNDASVSWNERRLKQEVTNYTHQHVDITDKKAVEKIFRTYNSDIKLIIHAAAQPSHDWAASNPYKNFTINANGTLILLEQTRKYVPEAVFIFTSSNKVYGDKSNTLPFVELETRWEIEENHPYFKCGVDENLSIDFSTHSLLGASKLAADILVQEYGRYFGLKTGIFRGGCLTGPKHSGTQMHGFLSYLMKCTITGEHYTVFGYKGKQVRDNIHSYDFVQMFWHFYNNPRRGEVYNAGGGRHSNCSMLEAITASELITGNKLKWSYSETNRIGDHIWWISDISKFKSHYPEWDYQFDMNDILQQLFDGIRSRL